MKAQRPVILLIEDDRNDQLLIEHAFRSIGVEMPIRIVDNGQQALDYLNGDGKYQDRERFPFPTTIITDLKMPKLDGFGVLERLKDNPH